MDAAIGTVIFLFFIVMNLVLIKFKIPVISIVFGLITWVLCISELGDSSIPFGGTLPAMTMIVATVSMAYSALSTK